MVQITIQRIVIVLISFVLLVNCKNGSPCYDADDRCPTDSYYIREGTENGQYCCPFVDDADGIILCKDIQFNGTFTSYSIRGKQCLNLDKDDNNMASSILTIGNNNCYRLYDEINCLGKSRSFSLKSPYHNDLEQLKFNDIASSIGRCYKDDYRFKNDLLSVGILSWLRRDETNLDSPVAFYQLGTEGRTEVMEAHIKPHHLNTGTDTNA